MRRFVTGLLRLAIRLFFRRIEIVGLEHVPPDAPVIFAANHPNGLVDPLFLMCFAPRPVSLLGKAPLFRYPIIGYFVRVLDSIPVYRRQDTTKGSNRETFGRAREVLRGGGSIAIFPEGTTHSDPRLRELKTGAARIALGAGGSNVIIAAGIYYTSKQTFRSDALVCFGEPVMVNAVEGSEDDEPSAEAVVDLTARIEKQLALVTLQADSHAALELIGRAERIFSSDAGQPLAEELELRKRFIDGYHELRARDPERLERLASSVRQFASELGVLRLDPEELTGRIDAVAVLLLIVLLPLALAGAIIHFIPYRIVDALSKRFSDGEDEMIATIKFLAALLIYPVTWMSLAFLVWRDLGVPAGIVALIVLPLSGYAALRVMEELDEIIGSVRAMLYRTRSRGDHERLVAHRQLIRDQIVAVAEAIRQ
jgi:glycerol-3-phosphate O-acyltransferase / dihydroxyacetone phosphate acyltransferase